MSAGIREIVTSEKADVVNTGTVKDAEGLSASTLTQKARAASQKPAIASVPKRGALRATPRGETPTVGDRDGFDAASAGRSGAKDARKPRSANG